MSVEPYIIRIEQEILDDLKKRLEQTRWPDEIPNSDWDYGTNLSYLQELVEYWITKFNWRQIEKYLNSFENFITPIKGTKIHFVYQKGKGPNPLPIIISHGWPSSYTQMLKLIGPLTDPEKYGGNPKDSFDVVVPSLPGFGFSDANLKRGRINVGDYWNELMVKTLGYEQYVAQGGDIGSGITASLGRDYPERVKAIHLTDAWTDITFKTPDLTDAEKKYLTEAKYWEEHEGAYEKIQGTKPQTLAYGLQDSPVGLAAWIVEKFHAWSDCKGKLENKFTKDELLTNIMIYWVTGTINSSMRYYYEYQQSTNPRQNWKIGVPTGISLFPKDIDQFPIEYAKRSYNVQKYTIMKNGGHFAALEEPDTLVNEIRNFFRAYR